MTPERFDQIRRAVEAARKQPRDRRDAFLDEHFGDDPELVREARSLLAHDDSNFLERSPHSFNVADLEMPSPARVESLAPNRVIGSYKILSELGAGSMGIVYRAQDMKLGREVAVKVLSDAFCREQARLHRFEREATLLAQLNHPNVATLHGLEAFEEQPFLVMELVEGETLAERIDRGAISSEEAVPLFVQIADALEAAHRKGIAHRDLKPANVMLTLEGRVKVLDFGLATIYEDVGGTSQPDSRPMTWQGTKPGIVLGTAPYMSPEQARGLSADNQSDIWAFGCCLFETLTGKPAFLGATVADTIAAVLEREPDWSLLPRVSSLRFERLLRRLLTKEKRNRVHHIADARIEIEDAGRRSSGEEARPGAKRGRRALFVMCVAAAIAVWSYVGRGVPVAKPVTYTMLKIEGALDLISPSIALSPDGRRLAYVADGGNGRRLHVRSLDDTSTTTIETNERATTPFFSPDGQWVGFKAGGRLLKVAAAGSEPVDLAPSGRGGLGASWSETGEIVFSRNRMGLWRVSEGGKPSNLTRPDEERRERTHKLPDALPGARGVLFSLGTADISSWSDGTIMVASPEDGAPRAVVEGGSSPRYSPSGHIVYARDGSLFAVPFDLDSIETVGAPVRVLEGVITNPVTGAAAFDIADNGTLVYASGEEWPPEERIVQLTRDGSVTPVELSGRFRGVLPSPDGSRLLVDVAGATEQLWLYALERKSFTRLTFAWGHLAPAWSHDGGSIAFVGTWPELGIYWAPIDSVSDAEPLVIDDGVVSPTSFSPDGALLAIDLDRPGTEGDIWLVSLEGEPRARPFLETRFDESRAVFSPDGDFLAYVSDETGRREVYLRRVDDPARRWAVSAGGGYSPQWSRDGRELFFVTDRHMMAVAVDVMGKVEVGSARSLFQVPERISAYNYGVSPDGQSFYMVERGATRRSPTELNLVLNWAEELKSLAPRDEDGRSM